MHQNTEPDGISLARTRGRVQQAGLAISDGLPNIFLKFEWFPVACGKPVSDGRFDSGTALLDYG